MMTEMSGSLSVQRGRDLVDIAVANVLFAFADGRWSYDCVACGAQCCRGHGYALNGARELEAQLSASTALHLFVSADKAGLFQAYQVRNLPPACFMLTKDGRCATHVTHGFAAKPETCRLFPFNQFGLLGDYLIVLRILSCVRLGQRPRLLLNLITRSCCAS
jgi:hypothetical protein